MTGYPPPQPDPKRFAETQYRAAAASYRAYARARRAATRVQKVAYRAQMRIENRSLRRASLVGPVLIIAGGIVFLLVCLGRVPPAPMLDWYSHWWPTIFILAGLIRLGEWFLDRRELDRRELDRREQDRREQNQQAQDLGEPNQNALAALRPMPTRGVGGGVVLLLILAGIFGAALPNASAAGPEWAQHVHWSGVNLEKVFGEKHTSDEDRDLTLPAEARLSITNPNGDITLTGHSSDGKVHLTLEKTVYAWSADDASSAAVRVEPRIDASPGNLSITVPVIEGSRVDLTLSLPETAPTTLSAGHGDINVSDMKAPVTLTSQHGDVELARLGSSVSVHVNSSGSTVNAHDIKGDLAVKGHAQDLNIADVTGEVALQGEFFGDGHVEHVTGPITFETSRTRFHTGRLDGELDISSGSAFTADHLSGVTTLRTHSRNIDLSQISGDITVVNRDGTVDLSSLDPLGNVSVENRSGAITLNLPPHPNVLVSAETHDGNIENNLELTQHKSDQSTTLSGQLGDAHNHIDLKTTHADITLHTGLPTAKSDSDDK